MTSKPIEHTGRLVGDHIDGSAFCECGEVGKFIGFMRDGTWQFRCEEGHWFRIKGDA